MNTPKLVSEIIVVIAVIALLATTVVNAIPKSLDGSPFNIELDDSGSTDIKVDDNMNVVLTLPDITFSSKLPEDFKDVSIDVYFGLGDTKAHLGGFTFGVVPANGSVKESFNADNLPVMLFMSYLPKLDTGDNTITLPLILDVKFKYVDWMDTQLLDLGISIQVQGTTGTGSVKVTVDDTNPNKSTAVLDASGSSGMAGNITALIKSKLGDDVKVTAGDASFEIKITDSNIVTVIAEGKEMTAAETLQKMYEDNGKLTFNYNGNEYDIEGDQAKALIDGMSTFYNTPAEA